MRPSKSKKCTNWSNGAFMGLQPRIMSSSGGKNGDSMRFTVQYFGQSDYHQMDTKFWLTEISTGKSFYFKTWCRSDVENCKIRNEKLF